MLTINTSQQVSPSAFSGVSGSPRDGSGLATALRPAGDVVKLGGAPTAQIGAAPELRVPRSEQGSIETDAVSKSGGLAGVIAMLIGMLNQLMLQDSQRVNASSGREVQLAASSANAQRKAGQAELTGGLSQAGATLASTAFGSYRSTKGTNIQIKTTKLNMPKMAESRKFAQGSVAPNVAKTFGDIGANQNEEHALMSLKGGKMQQQGDAFRAGGSALSKVAEASQGAAVSGHRAEQSVAAGDASVAGRTTDVELKTRSMNEELANQMRALRDRDIQSKNDVASHVAQGSR